MNTKSNIRVVTLVGLGIALNIVGAFIALTLKLPIYLDSIGTIFIACILGPKYAIITGLCGSVVSGVTFDIYSLYFAPVQISTGLLAGMMYRRGFLNGKKTPLGVLIFTIPTSLIGSVIAAYLFGGVTSSGSTYIVQMLKFLGVNDVVSVFITQIVTDYADKFVAVALVNITVLALPKSIMLSIRSKNKLSNYARIGK